MNDRLSVVVAQLNPCVGDLTQNTDLAIQAVRMNPDADLVVFTECFISGYPAEDLVLHAGFLAEIDKSLARLTDAIVDVGGPAVLIGAPEEGPDAPYNAAYMIYPSGAKRIAQKTALPNYGVFDEVRHFAVGSLRPPFPLKGFKIGVGICEEMWTPDVAHHHAGQLADLLIFINGSPYTRGKHTGDRLGHARARVRETGLPLLYVNQVGGQDEIVFDGASFFLDKDGTTAMQMPAFQTDVQKIMLTRTPALKITPSGQRVDYPGATEADYSACVLGLRDYVNKNGFPGVVIGISGGVDSALAAAMAVDALGANRVHGVTLPSQITSASSLGDAVLVARTLDINLRDIEIGGMFEAARTALGYLPDAPVDLTSENIQARVRMIAIMGISNRENLMPVTTGNKSEMSTGYATLYGDMAGGFNPLKDLYKTEVWRLCRWRNFFHPKGVLGKYGIVIPEKIIAKAPTAELRVGQTDEEKLGPYGVLDCILDLLVDKQMGVAACVAEMLSDAGEFKSTPLAERYLTPEHVSFIANLVRRAEYKRRQGPPGVKLGPRAFGRDRRYPIVNRYAF